MGGGAFLCLGGLLGGLLLSSVVGVDVEMGRDGVSEWKSVEGKKGGEGGEVALG